METHNVKYKNKFWMLVYEARIFVNSIEKYVNKKVFCKDTLTCLLIFFKCA